MKNYNKIHLAEEAISDTGSNIASGITLETLATVKNKGVNVYINMFTLYRNFTNCLEGNSETKIKFFKSAIDTNEIYKQFLLDSEIFLEAILELGFKPIVYIPNYKKIKSNWTNVREVNDFKGLKYFIMLTETGVVEQFKDKFKDAVIETTHKLPYNKDMFIITHIGLDLLNYVKQNDVKLLESHTGIIKYKNAWNSKYYKIGKHTMTIIPFNSLLYQIFGDSYMIKPQNMKLRKLIYEMAIKNKWYDSMTSDNILSFIKRKDSILGKDLSSLKINIF